MKKFLLCLVLILTLSFPVGCGGEVSIISSNLDVTLMDGSDSETINVTTGSYFQIEPPAKNGYLFLGYFDQENGGQKYVDENGKTLSKWKKGFPSTLYAQWKSIDTLKWESGQQFSDSEALCSYLSATLSLPLSKEFHSALNSNPGKNVKISISYKARNHAYNDQYVFAQNNPLRIYIKDSTGDGAETLASTKQEVTDSYASYNYIVSVPASSIANKSVVITFAKSAYGTDTAGHVKDVFVTFTFE